MLINMSEKDGRHVLMRETIDNIPKYCELMLQLLPKLQSIHFGIYT